MANAYCSIYSMLLLYSSVENGCKEAMLGGRGGGEGGRKNYRTIGVGWYGG